VLRFDFRVSKMQGGMTSDYKSIQGILFVDG